MASKEVNIDNLTSEEDFEDYIYNCLIVICEDLGELRRSHIQVQRDIEFLKTQAQQNENAISKLRAIMIIHTTNCKY